jgi:hypothetical protein
LRLLRARPVLTALSAKVNTPEEAAAFRNKIYSNLKQNLLQEKDMKSPFPSGTSGLGGQGPDLLRRPWCPHHGCGRLTAMPNPPSHPPARTTHASQMTKGLQTGFYRIFSFK